MIFEPFIYYKEQRENIFKIFRKFVGEIQIVGVW